MTPTERKRAKAKSWRPTAELLELPYVPEEQREHVRSRLAPILKVLAHPEGTPKMRVRGGDCWRIAQGLVMTGKDAGIKYVEGVWSRPDELDEGEEPVPHGWVTVDGHRVDLVAEFYNWHSFGSDGDWAYEPLKEYSVEELIQAEKRMRELMGQSWGFDMSGTIDESDYPEHLSLDRMDELKSPDGDNRNKTALGEFLNSRVKFEADMTFNQASQRLIRSANHGFEGGSSPPKVRP